MTKISIVDCGAGNLASIVNAFEYLGAKTKIISTPKEIENADRLVLPGVGYFGYFMEQLRANKLEEPLKKAIANKTDYLGICLGMQILFEQSEESPGIEGLGLVKGNVVRFMNGKVPQVGWNTVLPKECDLMDSGYAYFTNSYYCKPENENYVASITEYFWKFASAVRNENIFAVQFHPEKSGKFGLEILRRWIEC